MESSRDLVVLPQDIATVATFLASSDSGWITGETFHVLAVFVDGNTQGAHRARRKALAPEVYFVWDQPHKVPTGRAYEE